MTIIAAGASASYTLPDNATAISVALASGGHALIEVRRSGAVVYSDRLQTSRIVGPFLRDDVAVMTADGAAIDYSLVAVPPPSGNGISLIASAPDRNTVDLSANASIAAISLVANNAQATANTKITALAPVVLTAATMLTHDAHSGRQLVNNTTASVTHTLATDAQAAAAGSAPWTVGDSIDMIIAAGSAGIPTLATPDGKSITYTTSNIGATCQGANSWCVGSTAAQLPAPASIAAPITISGAAAVGSVLTATIGAGWKNTGVNWTRDAANISGATSLTYTTVAADAGHSINCVSASLPYVAQGIYVPLVLMDDNFLLNGNGSAVNGRTPSVSNGEAKTWICTNNALVQSDGLNPDNAWFANRIVYPSSKSLKSLSVTMSLNDQLFVVSYMDDGQRNQNSFYLVEVGPQSVKVSKWVNAQGNSTTALDYVPTTAWANNASATLGVLIDTISNSCQLQVNGANLGTAFTLSDLTSNTSFSVGSAASTTRVSHVIAKA